MRNSAESAEIAATAETAVTVTATAATATVSASTSAPTPATGDRQPRSGCGAAIVQDGRILLIQRLRDPEAGCWGLPGGKIDWMETVEHAIRREVDEELGIELGATSLLCVVDHFEPALDQHWISPVHLATAFSGEPQLREPEKHAAFAWFALDALPSELTASTLAALGALASR